MIKYTCNKCGEKKDLMRATIAVIEGKVRTKEALCECGEYMQEETKDFEGFPNLIRTDPSLSKNGVRNYQRHLRKNGRGSEADDIDKKL
jgi:hypothetical protein